MTDKDALLPVLPKPNIPDVTGTPLEGQPYVDALYHLLCSRWEPYRAAVERKRRDGVDLSLDDTKAFMARIPEEDLSPPAALVKFLRENNVIGDVYTQAHAVLAYSLKRLADAIALEENKGEGPSEKTEAAITRVWKRLMDMANLETQMYAGQEPELRDPDEQDAPSFAELMALGKKKTTLRAVEVTVEDS